MALHNSPRILLSTNIFNKGLRQMSVSHRLSRTSTNMVCKEWEQRPPVHSLPLVLMLGPTCRRRSRIIRVESTPRKIARSFLVNHSPRVWEGSFRLQPR